MSLYIIIFIGSRQTTGGGEQKCWLIVINFVIDLFVTTYLKSWIKLSKEDVISLKARD